MTMIKRALISGGGTGGHIFPALSIANALRRRYPDIEILFVGAENRMEMHRVPDAGYEIKGLPVAGFDRKKLWRNIGVLLKLRRSMSMAKHIVHDFKPDIAIGVGGYASGPTLKAAQKAGVPTLLQEQNSYPGVTNKLLAKRAKAICVAYDGLDKFFPAEKITLTGNPVRKDLCDCSLTQEQAKEQLGFDPAKPLVLVVGGSLGARTVNRCISAAAADIAAAGAQLLWQTGKKWRAEKPVPDGSQATTFISDMATAYRAADLVVSRAGAGTISELQLLGKATILVPSPNVAEDHQRKNAQALADRGAAVMVLDAEAPTRLKDEIMRLLADPALRASLSAKIKEMALPDSDEKIVDIIDQIVSTNQD
ncbi:MAG: undecaprenyldiphospho-muramoylpentapeptide beta-N-acetylglucosaminyltransferase [Muribaculaceae bacterium]|nr:undecaprenyldiphospho-muramoylpentapeptide beta-N-acetylglucosaminyltransferase [Muribaculaceae bacterium]